MRRPLLPFALFAPLALAASLPACGASATFQRVAPDPHPPRPSPSGVPVLTALPSAPFVKTGVLVVKTAAHPPTSDGNAAAQSDLQKLATENGCDAILPGAPEEKLYATSNGTPMYRTWLSADCLMYTAKE